MFDSKKEFDIVIDEEALLSDLDIKCFPFLLNKALKKLSKKEGLQYIVDELTAEFKRDPQLQSKTLLTSKAIHTCGVFKIRVRKDNGKGKSSGYRVIFLAIQIKNGGYVLDISDHSIKEDLTDEEKDFCNRLVIELDSAIKQQTNF